ncbi:MAG: glycosyltransferase family 2 protein [Rhodobacter sp.]|nr:glycosyltransferase family 2 protein [Rhodobacter sp.]
MNYRTPDLTLQAVEAALREMRGVDGELVIVDNASGDGSFEALTSAASANGWTEGGRVRVIQSKRNGGFGAGNNVGIRSGLSSGARPDYVYILNSDAFPDTGAIDALLAHLRSTPATGIAGSFIHGPDGAAHVTAFRFPSVAGEFEEAAGTGVISRLLAKSVVPLGIPDKTCPVDWLAGASLMIRAEVLDDIGLFDEGFFLYFDETDLCSRAALKGWQTVYVRESSVTHIGSASTGMRSWRRTPQYWFDSRMRYFVKSRGASYAALATLAHIAGAMIYRLRRLVSGKPRRDPPHFLRDLVSHALRTAYRGVLRFFRRGDVGPLTRKHSLETGDESDAATS